MNATKKTKTILKTWLLLAAIVGAALSLTATAHAAAPGITGPTFNLTAQPAYIVQPDGQAVYSWGYGCNGAPAGYAPAAIANPFCNTMQVPGPTLIVTDPVIGKRYVAGFDGDVFVPEAHRDVRLRFHRDPDFAAERLARRRVCRIAGAGRRGLDGRRNIFEGRLVVGRGARARRTQPGRKRDRGQRPLPRTLD